MSQWTSVHLCRKILFLLTLQPTHHWYLHYFLTSLYNHQTPWVPYLRPPYLTLSNLISLSLVLQHSCAHQNFQAPAILNSVSAFQIFRLILQNLQKLLTFPMFLLSITNLPMFLAKLKLKPLLLILLVTSKSIWKKVLNLQLVPYTLFWYLNKRLSRNLSRKTSIWVSSDQPHFHMVHRSYLLRRKMVHCISVSTSIVLTASPKKIVIHSHSSPIYWTHLAKLRFIQR